MSDITDLQSYKNREKLEKVHKEIEASELIDKAVESIDQCKGGLITIPEMLIYVEKAFGDLPREATLWGAGFKDQLGYIEKEKRQRLIDRFSTNIMHKLIKIANKLDQKGYYDLASELDKIIKGAK